MSDHPDVAWLRRLDPAAPVVLVLPGGKPYSTAAPSTWTIGQLRMRAFARALVDELPGVSVGTVRYRHRGWNGGDPADDVRTVLDGLGGTAPVALLGHSMGGRAAIAAAAHPRVAGVVGLAPWLPTGDGVATVAGRTVLLAHGSRDRWVTARLSADWAGRAQGVPDGLARFVVRGDSHLMTRHPARWHRLAVLGTAAVLGLGTDPVLASALEAGARGELAVALPDLLPDGPGSAPEAAHAG